MGELKNKSLEIRELLAANAINRLWKKIVPLIYT